MDFNSIELQPTFENNYIISKKDLNKIMKYSNKYINAMNEIGIIVYNKNIKDIEKKQMIIDIIEKEGLKSDKITNS